MPRCMASGPVNSQVGVKLQGAITLGSFQELPVARHKHTINIPLKCKGYMRPVKYMAYDKPYVSVPFWDERTIKDCAKAIKKYLREKEMSKDLWICRQYKDCEKRHNAKACLPHQNEPSCGSHQWNCWQSGKRTICIPFEAETPLEKTLAHWLRLKVRPGNIFDHRDCFLCNEYNPGLYGSCVLCPWYAKYGFCGESGTNGIEYATTQARADMAREEIIEKLKTLVLEEGKVKEKEFCISCKHIGGRCHSTPNTYYCRRYAIDGERLLVGNEWHSRQCLEPNIETCKTCGQEIKDD